MRDSEVELVECPRDAIQGIPKLIPTAKKIAYINDLIASGLFSCIDLGSFVSPKAVPQMEDTAAVLDGIVKSNDTKLLAIIANERGAAEGVRHNKIDFLGFPFSVSETFQLRNTNSTVEQSYQRVHNILEIMPRGHQALVVYISMAFGNPYGDPWSIAGVVSWIARLARLGVTRFSIADTTSMAEPQQISELFSVLRQEFPHLDFSAHLHSRAERALLKVQAAHEAGCRRFEGALLGFGGCPFAQDELVGNMPTELLLDYFKGIKSQEIFNLLNGFNELIRQGDEV